LQDGNLQANWHQTPLILFLPFYFFGNNPSARKNGEAGQQVPASPKDKIYD
jgi:hypothetical protein